MRYRWPGIPVLCLLPAAPLGGIAASRWADMRSKHSWKTIPESWESLGLPTAETVIDLHIALKPYRENALVDALNEVSDPGHPRYGMHLSREQVADIVAPHPETVQPVHSWLEYHRVTSSSVSVTHGGSFLTVTGVTVSQANNLLGASYQLYTHTKTNETIVRTLGYSLPVVLHGHVQTVAPTTFFSFSSPLTQWPTPRRRSGVAAVGPWKSPSGEPVTMPLNRRITTVTPAFLRWLYSTFNYVPSATDRNMVGVTGYANVDLQLSEGMTYPTPHIFYSNGFSSNGDAYLAWLGYVLSRQSVPPTITTSYGANEKFYPMEYASQVCLLFAQLGARGASVLFPSGDDGVGEGSCKANDGTVRFTPHFPATCPYVTTVGGTTSFMPEVGASLSGGGFSEYFPRPEYQQQPVSTFPSHCPFGRGIPDIAAQAMSISSFYRGQEIFGGGTSCSTPIVAGVISLLNDHRLSHGKPPLGFLNPWLYGGGLNGFNDVVSGSNPGCNTDGFSAIVGWDPVTGLGTPDFEQLIITSERSRELYAIAYARAKDYLKRVLRVFTSYARCEAITAADPDVVREGFDFLYVAGLCRSNEEAAA
ncbi:peptidase S8/S53 domain-containing protein [Lactarius deliciosus]|nr:peptidase S8/S53 domain-containing protein [Lactarius deliciosus]